MPGPKASRAPAPLHLFPHVPPQGPLASPSRVPPVPLVHFATSAHSPHAQHPAARAMTPPDRHVVARRFSDGTHRIPLVLEPPQTPGASGRNRALVPWPFEQSQPMLQAALAVAVVVGAISTVACAGLLAYGIVLLQRMAGHLGTLGDP